MVKGIPTLPGAVPFNLNVIGLVTALPQ